MAVTTTGTFPEGLWPGIEGWWGRDYKRLPSEWLPLYDIKKSKMKFEKQVELVGFGLNPVKPEGSATTYDSESQGYTTTYTHIAYSNGYIITQEALRDNLYQEIAQTRTTALSFSAHQSKEIVAANVYNRAFNSAFTGGDGIELLATNHPTSAGGGDQSNELAVAADLSEASIEDLTINIRKAQDSRGKQISIRPKCLIIPPDNQYEAVRILQSPLRSSTANNDINALKSMGIIPDIVVNTYLTAAKAWFIRTDVPFGMQMFQRDPMEVSQDNDFNTSNMMVKCYERYSVGWTDWRGLFGSPGV